jgi:predicted RNA methylase
MNMPISSAPTLGKPKKLGNTRITGKEQYYTPVELAESLISQVQEIVPDLKNRLILEPAGGTGSFLKAAAKAGVTQFLSFDIEPRHSNVIEANFLEAEFVASNAVTISNPPFGRNNSLSIPFFNKAANHSEFICFIVPRSWRKWSVINRLDRRFHLVADQDIQIDYEDQAGLKLSEKNSLATCFQIWQRKETLRPIYNVSDKGIVEKTDSSSADVALTIFGFGCGKVSTEFERKPNSTKMYLKLHHPQALKALQTVDFSKFYKNTAYTQALSLPEINYLLNESIYGNPHLEETV